jgi:segregation and condensation protein A
MKEPTLPWWRRALQFALGGIAGLFRRNGKVEAGREAVAPIVAAAYPPEEEIEETEEPREESRVKPSFPHSEPVAAKEAAARELEPAAKAVPARSESAAKEAAAPNVEPPPNAIPAESAPPASLDVLEPEPPAEFITPKAEPHVNPIPTALVPVAQAADELSVEPRNVKGHDRGTHPVGGSRAVSEEETIQISEAAEEPGVLKGHGFSRAVSSPAEEPEALKGHDFSRAVRSKIIVGALAPEASLPSINSEIPPDSEPTEPAATTPVQSIETTAPDQAAPAEAETETIAIAAQAAPEEEVIESIELAAQAAPQEATETEEETEQGKKAVPEEESAPEAEASSEQEAIPDEMQVSSRQSEHEIEPEPIAASASQEDTAPEPAEEPAEAPASPAAASPVVETLVQESEPAPQSEPIAAAVPSASAPAPAPPQDIAPILPFAEKSAQRTTAEKVAAALKARGEDAGQSPFSVLVNQVYDGPLDLLLDLIRKQDIDIYDIPIAKITAQFLAYVDRLRASDMDVAGDFIYTAALLIHIKSKMLLPRAPAGPDDALEDPRRELVERLLEHERFKNAAQMLLEKQMLEAATWTNPGIHEFQEDSAAEPEIAADTTDLVRVFSSILERARNRPIIDVEEDSVTVGQMIQFLARRLTMEDRPVALRRMLSHTRSERALIAMFLALLELVRLQAILLRQDRHFSEIFIKKHAGFDALMNQGLANARDDWR